MRGAVPEVIVALDVPSATDALRLVSALPECRFFKIGSELFTREGPAVVHAVLERGADVFLDLKFHDIPNTVAGACRSAAALGVRLLTVHASGGEAMVQAAVEGSGERCGVLAVTVLTSLDAATLGAAWGRSSLEVEDEVLRLAGVAGQAGAHGVVCSGREARAVRAAHGASLEVLVPGIRLPGAGTHDQARPVSPVEAALAGARYLVVGRAVTSSAEPAIAYRAVLGELSGVTVPVSARPGR